MEVVYSREPSPLAEGRTYRNPRFFTGVEYGVDAVLVVGDYPNIVAAYRAAGARVSVIDTTTARPPLPPAPDTLTPTVPEGERSSVEIPEDWRDMKWFALRGLATKFADAPVLNKVEAVAAIEAELARRAGEAETQADDAE